MELDTLFVRHPGGANSWYDLASPEVQAFMDAVADRAVEIGRDPVWSAVFKRLEADDAAPGSVETVRATLRKLIKARS
jgi:hypothetical protein